jgi:hypothetical protein
MYRLVIEHPQYIPKELQQGWNLRAGDEMGRIYRVFSTYRGAKLPLSCHQPRNNGSAGASPSHVLLFVPFRVSTHFQHRNWSRH